MTKPHTVFELWDSEITKKNVQSELDELTELTRILFDSSLSIISFTENGKPWYVSKKINTVSEIELGKVFNDIILNAQDELLIIEDTKLSNLDIFQHFPEISFFAGASLVSCTGSILGTLFVIDNSPKKVSLEQQRCLKILAKKATGFLNFRKLITEQSKLIVQNSYLFENLTELLPEIIFQLKISAKNKISFPYISKNLSIIHPKLSLENLIKSPRILYEILHPDDVEVIIAKIEDAYIKKTKWDIDVRVFREKESVKWYNWSAYPKEENDGCMTWFGVIRDISYQKEYEKTIEQISFDISHVLRKPITNMLGLTQIIENEDLSKEDFKKYCGLIRIVSDELNNFSKTLNQVYDRKRFSKSG